MHDSIPLLSLAIALLAVFFGPVISAQNAKAQAAVSLAIANKQIIAPMRQAWINSLRDVTAEFLSLSYHYFSAGYEDRTDEEYRHITLVHKKIYLMVNHSEIHHRTFQEATSQILRALEQRPDAGQTFGEAYNLCNELARDF